MLSAPEATRQLQSRKLTVNYLKYWGGSGASAGVWARYVLLLHQRPPRWIRFPPGPPPKQNAQQQRRQGEQVDKGDKTIKTSITQRNLYHIRRSIKNVNTNPNPNPSHNLQPSLHEVRRPIKNVNTDTHLIEVREEW